MTATYLLPTTVLLLRDGLEEDAQSWNALAESGDCFVTLATQLDELTHTEELPKSAQLRLESITRSLLYLQRHYDLIRKQSDYRQ